MNQSKELEPVRGSLEPIPGRRWQGLPAYRWQLRCPKCGGTEWVEDGGRGVVAAAQAHRCQGGAL